jgi:hypothetical protein
MEKTFLQDVVHEAYHYQIRDDDGQPFIPILNWWKDSPLVNVS